MKDLIYYPTFEPRNLDWLKYALIYIDQFSPIIPDSGKGKLSNIFSEIVNGTNLVKVHRPEWWQGDNASTKALREIEFIERHPEQYRDKLKCVNIIRTWREPTNWKFLLHEEKFNIPFKYECIKLGLGTEHNSGLLTSKELAQFYMTFLAEEIAVEEKGNPITDVPDLDNFSTYLRTRKNDAVEMVDAAKAVLSVTIPREIESIEIKKLIEFRNDSGIDELRKNFNNTLSKFYESVENDFKPDEYLKSLEKSNKELAKEIGLFFGGAVSTTLGALVLLGNPTQIELYKQIIDGTILTVTGGLSINKAWSDGKEKRSARKFINKISELRQGSLQQKVSAMVP